MRALWLALALGSAAAWAQAFEPNAYPTPQPAPQPQPPPQPAQPVQPQPQPEPNQPPPSQLTEEAPPPAFEPDGGTEEVIPQNPPDSPPAAAPAGGDLHVHGAIEASFVSFPSGTAGGQNDLFLNLQPIIGLDAGDAFAIEVGPLLRLRLFDEPPDQRDQDVGHILRGKDWDQTSDWGQLIRSFRIGKRDQFVWLEAGAVTKKSLGMGHLLTRYSNQDNPDYHPASATLGVQISAVRLEAFASDMLGARIFAGELTVDLGRAASNDPTWFDRIHAAVSVASDFGKAGYNTPGATLGAIDLSAVLWRGNKARVLALLGGAGRADELSGGALAGLALDAEFTPVDFGGKIELRKQGGAFRFGYFGPGYELSRFSGIGFGLPPISAERIPDGWSVYLELRSALGKQAVGDAAFEHYSWGRTDLDVSGSFLFFNERLAATSRFTMVGVGETPRYAISVEGRFRILPALYVLASAGTVMFPQADGTLARGFFIGGGAGIDFEK